MIGRPSTRVFLIALILFILSVVSHYQFIEFVTENRLWFAWGAFVVLAAGVVFRRL